MTQKIQELQCFAWPFKAIIIGILKKLTSEFWNYRMLGCIFRVMKACQSNTGSKFKKKKDPDYSLAEFPKCGAGICEQVTLIWQGFKFDIRLNKAEGNMSAGTSKAEQSSEVKLIPD